MFSVAQIVRLTWMHMSASATIMLLRTAGACALPNSCTRRGTHFLASPSSVRHSLPSAAQAWACTAAEWLVASLSRAILTSACIWWRGTEKEPSHFGGIHGADASASKDLHVQMCESNAAECVTTPSGKMATWTVFRHVSSLMHYRLPVGSLFASDHLHSCWDFCPILEAATFSICSCQPCSCQGLHQHSQSTRRLGSTQQRHLQSQQHATS